MTTDSDHHPGGEYETEYLSLGMSLGMEEMAVAFEKGEWKIPGRDQWRPLGKDPWGALIASTRAVRLLGDDKIVRFARSALDGAAEQVRDAHVWFQREHLEFLPPIGLATDGFVRECDDGEAELCLNGITLPSALVDEPATLHSRCVDLPLQDTPDLSVVLEYDRRNFDTKNEEFIASDSGGIASPLERWAALPPLEFVLTIAVTWLGVRFVGSLVDQLGETVYRALARKIASWAQRSKDPLRTVVFRLEFEYPSGARLCGFVLAPPNEVESAIGDALESLNDLAAIAGLQGEEDLLPSMKKAAFFLNSGEWSLGWWTDGETVFRTEWFEANPPDIRGVLGGAPPWNIDEEEEERE